MWSIGAIFLQIFTAFPLWMSLKSKVGKNLLTGIFAFAGRDLKNNTIINDILLNFEKIVERY